MPLRPGTYGGRGIAPELEKLAKTADAETGTPALGAVPGFNGAPARWIRSAELGDASGVVAGMYAKPAFAVGPTIRCSTDPGATPVTCAAGKGAAR